MRWSSPGTYLQSWSIMSQSQFSSRTTRISHHCPPRWVCLGFPARKAADRRPAGPDQTETLEHPTHGHSVPSDGHGLSLWRVADSNAFNSSSSARKREESDWIYEFDISAPGVRPAPQTPHRRRPSAEYRYGFPGVTPVCFVFRAVIVVSFLELAPCFILLCFLFGFIREFTLGYGTAYGWGSAGYFQLIGSGIDLQSFKWAECAMICSRRIFWQQ